MRYACNMDSIRQHKVPEWYENEKFGIFIHWGAYSVPAYAPPTWELGSAPDEESWFTNNPYAEWYANSIRIGRGPTWEYHVKHYGTDFPYERFVDMWQAEHWDPVSWAKLFKEAGARYVVPVTKHHDGLCLWNSAYTNFNTVQRGPHRDIIDELGKAVRQQGMRLGLYYSGIIDWSFAHEPILSDYDVRHPYNTSYDYSDYAYHQVVELIDRYQPSVLWNDIAWPEKGLVDLPYLFAYYYNTVQEGVVNDRWSGVWSDFTTKEYNSGNKAAEHKWECCRGLGLSFGYNQAEDERHIIAPNAFVRLLIDTVAYGGNLLINVGPKADGTIPEVQADRLRYIGAWLQENGEGIYNSRRYERQCDVLETGETLYYTQNEEAIYMFIADPHPGDSVLRVPGLGKCAENARALGKAAVETERDEDDLLVALKQISGDSPAIALRLGKGK